MSTLPAGITPAGSGKVGSQDVKWNILGHVYWLKAESDDCFAFETLDPPGTFVPPHVYPARANSAPCWRARSTLSRRVMD